MKKTFVSGFEESGMNKTSAKCPWMKKTSGKRFIAERDL
jgi:hypothetical protein